MIDTVYFSTIGQRFCPWRGGWQRLGLFSCAVLLVGIAPGRTWAQPAPDDSSARACEIAGASAEARYELPPGLLLAIGKVESGKRDPTTGRVAAWPWTINAQGRGQWFDGQAGALETVRGLQASGVASIDVGCFQVNLMYHPDAFPAVEDGFDPAKNADYAARFLLGLKTRWGSWDGAVAAYHSAIPERGTPYRERVMAGLARDGGVAPVGATAMPAGAVHPLPVSVVMRMEIWSPTPPAGGGMHIWTPSAAGHGAAVITISAPSSKTRP